MNLGQVRCVVQHASRILQSDIRRKFGSSAMCRKERWTGDDEKWDKPKGEWNSFFHYFAPEKGITVDIVHLLQKPISLSPSAFLQRYRRYQKAKTLIDQSYVEERVAAVGCELAAAHFMVYRGGKVRQKGSSEWIEKDKDGNYNLPRHYTPGYFVEDIDARGVNIIYEGLECIGQLQCIKWLNLADCPNIDDWCIDRICGQFSSTLEYLNLSNCTKISEKGISALARLRQLKTLDLSGLDGIRDIELLCLLIEDVIPGINIIGINYMEPPVLQESISEELQ